MRWKAWTKLLNSLLPLLQYLAEAAGVVFRFKRNVAVRLSTSSLLVRFGCPSFAILTCLLLILTASVAQAPPPTPKSFTVPFILDNNRVFVDLTFTLPDGTSRKTLAFVDMGDPDFELSMSLVNALQIQYGHEVNVRLGDLPLTLDSDLQASGFEAESMFTGLHVESNLPSKVLRHYTLVFDYSHRTLTLAEPGTMKLEGQRVPLTVNAKTGLVNLEAKVNGRAYAMAIDNGAAYTWISQDVATQWTHSHPDWLRGIGAVGHSNMNGSVPEVTGTDIRIPIIDIGSVKLEQVGALGVGPGFDPKANPRFFDWYSQKTAAPVVAFLGGNVLKSFRFSIDYAEKVSYWQRQQPDDPHDLDQIGITLRPDAGKDTIIKIATQKGRDSVSGVLPEDILVSIDGMPATGAPQGKVLEALHGNPGDTRRLVLSRNGKERTVVAKVARF